MAGTNEAVVIRDAIRAGHPIPPEIANAPSLMPGLDLFYNAWLELSTCRSIGMVPGPIPWTAIHMYARHYQMTFQQEERLVQVVRILDNEYLKSVK